MSSASTANGTAIAVDECDVVWAADILGLPSDAFTSQGTMDPRFAVLKSMETLDVEACPGSGKTTLLVAKLAILGRKWNERRRGICVLSHTNVARREIEKRLGNTAVGQRLLHYPHFIGTIHGFVNEFLALPWLRSMGYPIEVIDDAECLSRRWRKLSYGARSGLERNRHTERMLRFEDTRFNVGEIRWGKTVLGRDTPTYRELRRVCKESAERGFFCYDEMFVWAHDLMDEWPAVRDNLRRRFPLLFVDEVQDNDEAQSKLLHRVFVDGGAGVMRQRFGDSNQAIFQRDDGAEATCDDGFPDAQIRCDLPSSFRFDQSIAELTDSFAVRPQGLRGLRQSAEGLGHAILLFEESTLGFVLECYARYLIGVFSAKELQDGVFAAVGAVHRRGKDDNLPRSVGDYWNSYDQEIGASEPHPESLIQYVRAGRRLAEESGEVVSAVELLAEGILKAIRIAAPEKAVIRRRRLHRYLSESLGDSLSEKLEYEDLMRELCIERVQITKSEWVDKWAGKVRRILARICGAAAEQDAVKHFLGWNEVGGEAGARIGGTDNLFRFPTESPRVVVRVGSIHSVKGETHTATLVLETFYRAHHLKALKGWVIGRKSGGVKEKSMLRARLRLHYVAMSRPSHLLCLAMRAEDMDGSDIERAQGNGWRVGRVLEGGAAWL